MAAFDQFIELYGAKCEKACACLEKDRSALLTFCDFPAEHWRHLRTTNPIESSFATIRHRARQTKGCGSRLATLGLMFQLGRECEKSWRCLNGSEQIQKLIEGRPLYGRNCSESCINLAPWLSFSSPSVHNSWSYLVSAFRQAYDLDFGEDRGIPAVG